MYQAEWIQRRSQQQLSPIGEHNGAEPPFIYLLNTHKYGRLNFENLYIY